jgi:sterol desaturase/sphingolipid hydroxylase (fatty acid hydroxylase superfamily)
MRRFARPGTDEVARENRMGLLTIEHGKAAYRADFAVYGAAVVTLGAFLLVATPPGQRAASALGAALGLAGWTVVEYVIHRFVLHGMAPFKVWHEEHHRRPTALICAPTVLSASLIFVLVFLPVLALDGLWRACAVTLGVLAGYLAYAVTHHATHHWQADNAWLKRRKRWHALHHHRAVQRAGFGVTSAFWDHVFATVPASTSARRA